MHRSHLSHQVALLTRRESIRTLLPHIHLQTLRNRIKRMLAHPLLSQDITSPVAVCVTLTDNEEIQMLNAQYRQQDKATDVLSFALNEGDFFFTPIDEPLPLGDIIISIPKAASQVEAGALPRLAPYYHGTWDLQAETSFLMLHGLLHLLGYDHIDEKDRVTMEALEHQLLPYLLGQKRGQKSNASLKPS